MRIPGLRGLALLSLLKQSAKQFFAHDMDTHAAALTYHTIFALFPFALFLISLISFLNISYLLDWLREIAKAIFMEETMRQFNVVLQQLEQRRQGLLSMTVLGSIWAASFAFRAVINALNAVYGVKEDRPLWKVYLSSVFYSLIIGIMFFFAGVLFLIGPQVMLWVLENVGVADLQTPSLILLVCWASVVLLLTLIVALIYGIAPDVEQRSRFVTPGALLAVLVWIAASFGFQYYVHAFVNFNAMYGSVGTIIVFLLYFYVSSWVLLFGAEVNAVIEQHAPLGKNSGEKTLHR